ncbi:hypothetical protein B0J11DRAFT_608257 [Dendryphion nanum]|uniref:Uncharacterized protein n=1 Tax=Dendryphion nanum TaxID=256645 RepID=A0A9P9DP33_9PLEO|nr:hypothetical protein B0J11DRAFT_608257 [Dendryphion nanum]
MISFSQKKWLPQDSCPIFRLPPELRLMVWEKLQPEVFFKEIEFELAKCGLPTPITLINYQIPIGLLSTCRQVHSEVASLYKKWIQKVIDVSPQLVLPADSWRKLAWKIGKDCDFAYEYRPDWLSPSCAEEFSTPFSDSEVKMRAILDIKESRNMKCDADRLIYKKWLYHAAIHKLHSGDRKVSEIVFSNVAMYIWHRAEDREVGYPKEYKY